MTEIRKQIIGSGCPVRERERERGGRGREKEKVKEMGKERNNLTIIVIKLYHFSSQPLINPQRRFLKSFPIQQVNDMHKRAIRRHRRTMLLFNDVLLVRQ